MLKRIQTLCALFAVFAVPAFGQRQMERLGRGVVVLRNSSTQVYVGWRLLGNDPEGVAFNLYRSANGGAAVKVNASPLTATTDYVDTPANLGSTAYTYSVRPVLGGVEVTDTWANTTGSPATLPANASTRQYLPVPLQPPPGMVNADYSVKFAWVGDLDGDGEFDFVVERTPSTADAQWIQAYKRDGTLLWQMSQGPNSIDRDNIYPGSSAIAIGHNDNVTVYDLDGDGKSEVCVLTANGVVFANGSTLTAPDNEVQYISIIDGETGIEKARELLPIPASWAFRENVTGHFGIVYADGTRPSLIFQASNRDPSTLHFYKYATTWDYRGGVLSMRWLYDFETATDHVAEGHQIRLADVNNDGRDEYVDIGHIVKADGSGQINGDKLNDIVHGDRFHVTDIDPDRPGLETFIIQQNNGTGLATALFAADKSETIRKWYAGSVVDVGRGTIGGFVPGVDGLQMFSTMAGVYDCKGDPLYASQPWPVETIWWDGDAGRELLTAIGGSGTSPGIDKFNTANGSSYRLISLYSDPNAPGSPYNNYIAYGARPQFWGDILGDWREELVCMATDNSELRIYTTNTPDTAKTFDGLTVRIPTLMHDPQYRIQATTKGYVQSGYPSYYLGYNMPPPPLSPMVDADLVWKGGTSSTTWDVGATASWTNAGAAATYAVGDSVLFDMTGDPTTNVTLSGTLQPGAVTVFSPTDFTFDGAGTFAGPMKLAKSGAGTMVLPGTHSFTGKTTIWDGSLEIDGSLTGSPVTVWGGTWGGAAAKGLTGGRLAGTGTVSQAVQLRYRGAITPGAGMDSAGTLTLGSGLDARDGSVLAFDLSNNPSGANDRLAITGNLSLSGTVAIVVNATSGQLSPGTYTLATYTGSLTGSTSNLSVAVPDGTPYTVSLAGGALTLTVPITRAAGTLTWQGGQNGNVWDLANTPNWLNTGTPDTFVSGDTVHFDDTGTANASVTLNAAMPVGGMDVSGSADYSFTGTGSITGSGGLTKSGTGTLTLGTTNSYTGPTLINGGVLEIDNLGDGGAPSSIGASSGDAANFVIDGGTLRLVGAQTNTNRSLTIGAGGAGLEIPTGISLQISGGLTGPGGLVKAGDGTFIIAAGNSYAGGTVIQAGLISLFSDDANVSGLGSGGITFESGTLRMYSNNSTSSAATSSWPIHVPAGASGRLDADSRCKLSGSLTGAGDFTFYTPYVRTDMRGDWSGFAGVLHVITDSDGGDFRIDNSFGYGNAVMDLNDGVYVYYIGSTSSLTIPVGTLSGTSGAVLKGGASSLTTWQVGGRNEDSTYAGVIVNSGGGTALTKLGTGTLTLTGASTHTGTTTVSAGRLRIDGSASGSNFTVQNGGTLGGSGSITGNVAVQSGGALELNAAPLAITGNLTFSGNAVIRAAGGYTPTAGTYTVATYTGTLSGAPSFVWEPPSGSSFTATFDTSTAGEIKMTLVEGARAPGPVIWTGASSLDWDAATENWVTGSDPTAYLTGDTATFTDAGDASAPINIIASVQPANVVVDSSQDYVFSGAGAIDGSTAVNVSGAGSLTLMSPNGYSGGTNIGGGARLVLGTNASFSTGGLGTGTVGLSGTLAHGFDTGTTLVYAETIDVPSGQTGTVETPNRFRWNSAVTGSGALNIAINTTASRADFQNSFAGFTGAVNLTGSGTVRLGVKTLGSGQPNFNGNGWADTTLSVDGVSLSVNTYSSGGTVTIGALAGNGETGVLGGGTAGPPTYTVGGLGSNTTFGGGITGNAILTKEGVGSLTLTNTTSLTYTGATTVSSGRLVVNGTLATSPVSVAATAALGGTGSIGGSVTCNGTLSPGASPGTLTLSSGLVLSSTSKLDYELGAVSDLTVVTGNLTLDGTVNVTPATGFGPGTYTLVTYTGSLTNNTLEVGTLPAGFNAAVDTGVTGQVRLVVSAPLSYASWENQMFSPAQIAAGESATDQDPDHDGLTNLAEYALGGLPYAFTPPPAVTRTATDLSITFQRPADVTDVIYHAEASSNLTTWEELTLEVLNPGGDPETVRATKTLGAPAPEQQFLRLRFVK